ELVVAHNILISSCSNCTAVTGTDFEPASFPVGQWTVSGGVLGATGASFVTSHEIQPLVAGQNIQLTYAGGQITISGNNLTVNQRTRMFGYTFDLGGAEIPSGLTKYLTVPFACALSGWNLVIDKGAATVSTWRQPKGNGIPTIANTINTNGVSISSGTSIHSADLTDFNSTAVNAGDVFGFHLGPVTGAGYVNFILECLQ